ncbi:DUF3558 family protein [[Kitasatospora] papulosa]|uniref:DUF3558 family protein n=1 Tax=Streptomyces TaxID=1883 RepID=UPI0025B54941|nr:DUF3558 family protein [Streptomyces sp. P9-2B-1]WJY35447.1 DUF3558 family protein [Streptomyces sp. P9-2B-1]
MYRRTGPLLVLVAAVLTAAGCSSGSQAGPGTSAVSQAAAAPSADVRSVDQDSVCDVLSESQQEDIGAAEATPDSDDGYVTCYYPMTLEGDPDPSGYEVTVFDSAKALRETVDATDVMPTKALPLQLDGHSAAEQITYGDQWSAAVTVEVGGGRFLYVEKYAKGHSVSEKELSEQARGTAKKVLRNLLVH